MGSKKILITTIGNRDLQISKIIDELGIEIKNSLFYSEEDLEINKDDPKYYLIHKNKFREITKRLYDNLERYNEIIKFFEIPILRKILEKEGNFEKILIIATDQSETNRAKSNTDTLYEAELIRKTLERRYGYDEEKIEVITIREDLGDYGKVLREFLNEVLKRFRKYEKDYELVINTTGGVPALQAASLLLLRDRSYRLVYLPQGEKEPKYVNEAVKNEIDFLRKKDLLKNLVRNYEYNYILLESSDFRFILNKNKKINLLLRFLKERKIMNLCNNQLLYDECEDFKELILNHSYLSSNIVDDICKKGKSPRSLDLDLALNYKKAQLMEFVEILKIDLIKKDYTSFIGKLFRLTDSISVILIVDYFLSITEFKKDLPKELLYDDKFKKDFIKELLYNEKFKKDFLKEMLYDERIVPENHKSKSEEITKVMKYVFGIDDAIEGNLNKDYPNKFKENLEAKEGELFLFAVNESYFKTKNKELYDLLYLFLLPQINTVPVGPRRRRDNVDLRTLRNKSQYGHGFKPVDGKKVNEILEKTIGRSGIRTIEYYYEKVITRLVEKITGRTFEETKSFSFLNNLILKEIDNINFLE